MGLNILELRIGRDVLLIAPRGTLHRNAKRIQYNPCSPSTLDRFLRSQDNLDKLRRLWSSFQPLPKMSRLTDQDLSRMLKSAVGKSQVEAVIISTATVALPGMDSQQVAQARKIGSGAQQRNGMQGAASGIGMQAPSRGGMAGQMASRGAMATPTPSRGATPTVPIAAWPIEQRLQFVVERARKKVPAHTGEALKELVSPESIGLMVGLIAVGGLAQLTPVGWAVDAALIGLAFVFGGLAAVHALGEMVECFQAVNNAKSEADLERAAVALSRAIVGLGLVALIALLRRVAKGNKGGGSKKGGSTPEVAQSEAQKIEAVRTAKPVGRAKPVEQGKQGAAKSAAQESAAKNASKASRAESEATQSRSGAAKDGGVVANSKALDDKFGQAQPPGGKAGIKPFEQEPGNPGKAIKNPTLQKPTPENPPKLDPAKAKDPGYIWAIDEQGNLLIAEEVPAAARLADGYQPKLGHPTLTEGKPARIAGELKHEDGKWSINNNSGRYSEHPDRTPDKLGAAAEKFGEVGVPVEENFNSNRLPK